MGKSMYNIGNRTKERARQQKQIDKASKRILAGQKEVCMKTSPQNADSNITEPIIAEGIVKSKA
jgi:hypothetical protein